MLGEYGKLMNVKSSFINYKEKYMHIKIHVILLKTTNPQLV